jgi:outer membrane protein assembly factor BamB
MVLGNAAVAAPPPKAAPALQWRFPTAPKEDWVIALAVGQDGIIYCGSWVGSSIYALTPDGSLQHMLTVDTGVHAFAVGRDGTIYAGSGDKKIYVFDLHGSPRSTIAVPEGVVQALVEGPGGVIYAGGSNDHVYAVGPDGTVRWKFMTQAPVAAMAIGRDEVVYAGSGNDVYVLASDGTPKSKFAAGTNVVSLVASREGTLYVGSRDQTVRAVDPTEGTSKWSFKARGTPFALAEGNDGTIHVGAFDGNVYALDAQSGRLKWTFTTGTSGWGKNPVHAIAVAKSGIIYAASGASVEAISLDGGAPPDKRLQRRRVLGSSRPSGGARRPLNRRSLAGAGFVKAGKS